MASLTFFTDDYGAKKALIPDIGDITNWGSDNPVTNGMLATISELNFKSVFDNETYRLTNLITLSFTTSNIYLYTNPQKSSALRVFNYNSTINKFLNIDIYSTPSRITGGVQAYYLDNNDRTVYICGALATISGNRHFGLLAAGFSSQGRPMASFLWNASLDTIWAGSTHSDDPDNPYEGAGDATTGGGDPSKQNWDELSDTIGDESLPDESVTGAIGTGFSTIFSPSKGQLQHLADVMWGNDIVSFLQNQVENIGSMFVSLGIVPFAVSKGSTRKVMWLGLVDTAIYLDTAASQFYTLDMGSINMATDLRIHRTDSVFDYSPFSKLGIYLPFIGFQELDIDECRNAVISLKYKVDILSGSCVAWVYINGDPIYQFSGNYLTQIPLSSQDAQTLFTNAVNVGIAAAGVGTAGAVASAGDALTAEKYMAGEISATGAEVQAAQHAAQVSSSQGSLASATANGMMGMKPSYKRSGGVSASTSLISLKQPYLFLTTPREAVPQNYQKYCGFPSNITKKLGDLSGFTVVEDIRLNGLVATSPEVEEIYQLLKTGVIV